MTRERPEAETTGRMPRPDRLETVSTRETSAQPQARFVCTSGHE